MLFLSRARARERVSSSRLEIWPRRAAPSLHGRDWPVIRQQQGTFSTHFLDKVDTSTFLFCSRIRNNCAAYNDSYSNRKLRMHQRVFIYSVAIFIAS